MRDDHTRSVHNAPPVLADGTFSASPFEDSGQAGHGQAGRASSISAGDRRSWLGWQRWRELDEQANLGWIRAALTYAAEAGRIDRRHVDAFAHIVLAAANEVALMIARADDPAAALTAGESAVAELLDRLLGAPG
jgi:hypothetical protein